MSISRETLEDTIENLEALVAEHDREHAKYPQMLGYEEHFFSHKERADDYRTLLGYLRELKQLRENR